MDYVLINSVDDIAPYLPGLIEAKALAVDTETTGLDPHIDRIRLLQLAAPGLPIFVIDCFHFLPEGLTVLKELLEGPGIKIFQNAKFDLQFLMALGLYPCPVFDTMLAGQLLRTSGGPPRVNLAALAQHYLNENLPKDEQKSDWRGELTESQLRYAARDAEILPRLREVMAEALRQNGLSRVAFAEFSCARAVAEMEYAGINLDTEGWKRLVVQTEAARSEAERVLQTYAEVQKKPVVQISMWGDEDSVPHYNFDSNQYILHLLRANGIPVDATSKRNLSAHAAHPLIKAVSDYRRAAKALSSFLYPIPHMIHKKTGRLHPRYGQIGAWSGRMSCGGPNIQQIPRDINFRACFTAPPGRKLIIADYSQIELRVAAQIAGDRRMTEAYKKGEDLHTLTASLVSDVSAGSVTKAQRQAAKAVNFGLIFGMGAAGLQQYAQQSYGVDMTLDQAAKFRDSFFRAYPGIASWHRRVKNEKPTEERTLMGRKFTFGENAGFAGLYNTPVQGTAADIAKSALGMLTQRTSGTSVKIIAAVHDEILLEADEADAQDAAQMLKETMEAAGNAVLSAVPCVAEVNVADSWAGK